MNKFIIQMSTGRKLQTKHGARQSEWKLIMWSLLTRAVGILYVALFPLNISNKLYKLKIIQTNTNPEWVFFVVVVVIAAAAAAAVEYCSTRGIFQLDFIRIIRLSKHYARAIKIKMVSFCCRCCCFSSTFLRQKFINYPNFYSIFFSLLLSTQTIPSTMVLLCLCVHKMK